MEIPMTAIVYVASNAAMPGLVKIGTTSRDDVHARLDELYGTGVPFPFKCEMVIKVNNEDEAKKVEETILREFHNYRPHEGRDFLEEAVVDQVIGVLENEFGTRFEAVRSTNFQYSEDAGVSDAVNAAIEWADRVNAIRVELARRTRDS